MPQRVARLIRERRSLALMVAGGADHMREDLAAVDEMLADLRRANVARPDTPPVQVGDANW